MIACAVVLENNLYKQQLQDLGLLAFVGAVQLHNTSLANQL